MNFTKEYIELCKCKEIQGLQDGLYAGDKYYNLDFYVFEISTALEDSFSRNSSFIWLPTGDQLDEEIVKICKENEFEYRIDCGFTNDFATAVEVYNFEEKIMEIELWDNNPLIAKIKLLIQLKGM